MLLQTQSSIFLLKSTSLCICAVFSLSMHHSMNIKEVSFCAIVNSATVNMEIHIFDILISFGYISHGGMLPDNMRISIFNSLF